MSKITLLRHTLSICSMEYSTSGLIKQRPKDSLHDDGDDETDLNLVAKSFSNIRS